MKSVILKFQVFNFEHMKREEVHRGKKMTKFCIIVSSLSKLKFTGLSRPSSITKTKMIFKKLESPIVTVKWSNKT